jgi:hypothetical protein
MFFAYVKGRNVDRGLQKDFLIFWKEYKTPRDKTLIYDSPVGSCILKKSEKTNKVYFNPFLMLKLFFTIRIGVVGSWLN